MIVQVPEGENIRISNSEDIARIMRKVLTRQNRIKDEREYFWTIGLSSENDIEYIELLNSRNEDVNSIKPVNIFNFAVTKRCDKLILCHNRLSKNVMPNAEDKDLTQKLKKGAEALEIQLLDHIIICAKKNYCSMVSLNMI